MRSDMVHFLWFTSSSVGVSGRGCVLNCLRFWRWVLNSGGWDWGLYCKQQTKLFSSFFSSSVKTPAMGVFAFMALLWLWLGGDFRWGSGKIGDPIYGGWVFDEAYTGSSTIFGTNVRQSHYLWQ